WSRTVPPRTSALASFEKSRLRRSLNGLPAKSRGKRLPRGSSRSLYLPLRLNCELWYSPWLISVWRYLSSIHDQEGKRRLPKKLFTSARTSPERLSSCDQL